MDESVICTATYVVSPGDIAAGLISNTATAVAFGPNGHFISDTDTVMITAPVATDDPAETDEDSAVIIDVAMNDVDADGNLDLTSITVTSGPSDGTAIPNGDGTITYTPDPDFNGSDSFVYEICDNDGLGDTAVVMITVHPLPD